MERPADFSLRAATDRPTAALSGDWTAEQLGPAADGLAEALRGKNDVSFDLLKVRRMDTAGAYAMIRAAGESYDAANVNARPEHQRLLKLVDDATHVAPVVRREPQG